MIEVQTTEEFTDWLKGLRDRTAAAIVNARILRVRAGLMGDVEPVSEGVSELRIDHGPGYRVYFAKKGKALVILLCGGDKSSQSKDIKKAKKMAAQL
jgi:putative addiction module killer protein